MFTLTRVVCTVGLGLGFIATAAADAPKDSPFGQAGAAGAPTSGIDAIDFAGVSTVGNRTMINLYDKQQKRSFWVEAGKANGDLTVTNYDSAHDQITVKSKGAEKVLPLRPPSAVVNGTAPTAVAPIASSGAAAGPAAASTPSLSQARQEEEARMLVSDLLEIGMAQRKAYEEAQRRTAQGLPPHPTSADSPDASAASGSPTQPATTAAAQPAPAATTATPSS